MTNNQVEQDEFWNIIGQRYRVANEIRFQRKMIYICLCPQNLERYQTRVSRDRNYISIIVQWTLLSNNVLNFAEKWKFFFVENRSSRALRLTRWRITEDGEIQRRRGRVNERIIGKHSSLGRVFNAAIPRRRWRISASRVSNKFIIVQMEVIERRNPIWTCDPLVRSQLYQSKIREGFSRREGEIFVRRMHRCNRKLNGRASGERKYRWIRNEIFKVLPLVSIYSRNNKFQLLLQTLLVTFTVVFIVRKWSWTWMIV